MGCRYIQAFLHRIHKEPNRATSFIKTTVVLPSVGDMLAKSDRHLVSTAIRQTSL
jgi:hypothetical protein